MAWLTLGLILMAGSMTLGQQVPSLPYGPQRDDVVSHHAVFERTDEWGVPAAFAENGHGGQDKNPESDQLLEELWDWFLTAPAEPVFAAWEREILLPERVAGTNQQRLPDGRTVTVRTPGKDYYAVLQVGERVLLAHSLGPSVRTVSDFPLAERLNGYNPRECWVLSLDRPIRHLPLTNSRLPTIRAPRSLNRLFVLPRAEIQGALTQQQTEPQLLSVLGTLDAVREVFQFGYTGALAHGPTPNNDRLLFSPDAYGHTASARLTAAPSRVPVRLEYYENGRRTGLEVHLGKEGGSITIARSAAGRKTVEIIHRLLVLERPTHLDLHSAFAWQTYVTNAEPLVATLRSNHQDFEVELGPDGSLEIRRQMPSRASTASTPRGTDRYRVTAIRAVLIVVMILTTIGTLVFAGMRFGRRQAQPSKRK